MNHGSNINLSSCNSTFALSRSSHPDLPKQKWFTKMKSFFTRKHLKVTGFEGFKHKAEDQARVERKKAIKATRRSQRKTDKKAIEEARARLHPNVRGGVFSFRKPHDPHSMSPKIKSHHFVRSRILITNSGSSHPAPTVLDANVSTPACARVREAGSAFSSSYIEAKDQSFALAGVTRDLRYSGPGASTSDSSRATEVNLGSVVELCREEGRRRHEARNRDNNFAAIVERRLRGRVGEARVSRGVAEESIERKPEENVLPVVERRLRRRVSEAKVPLVERYQREEREKLWKRE